MLLILLKITTVFSACIILYNVIVAIYEIFAIKTMSKDNFFTLVKVSLWIVMAFWFGDIGKGGGSSPSTHTEKILPYRKNNTGLFLDEGSPLTKSIVEPSSDNIRVSRDSRGTSSINKENEADEVLKLDEVDKLRQSPEFLNKLNLTPDQKADTLKPLESKRVQQVFRLSQRLNNYYLAEEKANNFQGLAIESLTDNNLETVLDDKIKIRYLRHEHLNELTHQHLETSPDEYMTWNHLVPQLDGYIWAEFPNFVTEITELTGKDEQYAIVDNTVHEVNIYYSETYQNYLVEKRNIFQQCHEILSDEDVNSLESKLKINQCHLDLNKLKGELLTEKLRLSNNLCTAIESIKNPVDDDVIRKIRSFTGYINLAPTVLQSLDEIWLKERQDLLARKPWYSKLVDGEVVTKTHIKWFIFCLYSVCRHIAKHYPDSFF